MRGIEVLPNIQPEPDWPAGRRIARKIAENYLSVYPLLAKIKQTQGSGERFILNLRDRRDHISDLLSVANHLRDAGLLPDFRYLRNPYYRLEASPPVAPEAINFLIGGWLELYASDLASSLVRHARKAGRCAGLLARVPVRMPNAQHFELDVCVACDEKLIWIEAKTGTKFNNDLPKYKKIRGFLGVPRAHAILLMSDFGPGDSNGASRAKLAGMTACSVSELKSQLVSLLAPRPS